MPKINNNIVPIKTLNDSVDDFTLSVNKAGIDGISFSIFHFLYNDLLGRLSSDAPEGGSVHFCPEAIADFTSRIQLSSLFHADLQVRFCNDFGNIFKLEDLYFAGRFIVLNFNIDAAPKFFPRSRY